MFAFEPFAFFDRLHFSTVYNSRLHTTDPSSPSSPSSPPRPLANGLSTHLTLLIPHAPGPALVVTADVSRRSHGLHVQFEMTGDVDTITWDNLGPGRHDELWRHTCFECFFRVSGADPYVEVNAAVSGGWNAYRLTHYRAPLEAAAAVVSIRRTLSDAAASIALDVTMTIAPQPLDVGVAAIIETVPGGVHYFAIGHPGPAPDFHHPDSFLIELAD